MMSPGILSGKVVKWPVNLKHPCDHGRRGPIHTSIASEGHIQFREFETWYRFVGETETGKYPVLCLHGGPGSPHDYLEPLEALADSGRRVIFYDQLGCGRSSRPSDPSLWTTDLFVDELRTVRRALGLDRLHLLGHSWGGMLATEYVTRGCEGLVGLVLASSLPSTRDWPAEMDRLRSELPPEVRAVLDAHEAAGTIDDPLYEEALMVFYRKHACRSVPWPDCLERSFTGMRDEVYNTMWGPNEMLSTGTLKNWDMTDRLQVIDCPTLITSGRFDECTPAITETIHLGVPNSEWVIFEESSHLAFIEETDRYISVLNSFFARWELSSR